ncbi:MAG: hypothetical protein ACE5IY_07675 [bacterium]
MYRTRSLMLALLGVLASGCVASRPKSTALERWGASQTTRNDAFIQKLLDKAYGLLYDENEFSKARAYYSFVLDMEPNNAEANLGLSFANRYLGYNEQALEACAKAIALDSLAPAAQWNYGELLWPWRGVTLDEALTDKERIRLSIRYFNRATSSGRPTSKHAHISLWTAYMALCQPDKMHEQMLEMKRRDYFPQPVLDFAYNLLIGLDQNAILITNGDMDTYPTICMQEAFGVRPDVLIINQSLIGLPLVVRCMLREFDMTLPDEYPVGDQSMPAGDEVLNNVIESARKQNRSVYFAITIAKDLLKLHESDLTLEGVVFKFDDVSARGRIDIAKLEENMTQTYRLAIPGALSDWSSNLSPTTRNVESAFLYNYILLNAILAGHHAEQGETQMAVSYYKEIIKLYSLLDNDEGMINILRQWLSDEPENPEVKFLANKYL